MSVLSKIFLLDWNLPYNCYELGHTWTPLCSEAALEIGLTVFQQSLKLYVPLYLMNQAVFQRKFDFKNWQDTVKNILRSSTFLGLNAFLVILFFCLSRQMLGKFYYSVCATVPSFIGSFFAIFVEGSSRRKALAFYVANIASESFYKTMVSRDYIRPVRNGKYLLFAASTALLVWLFDRKQLKDPFVQFVFKLVLGNSATKISTLDSKSDSDASPIPPSSTESDSSKRSTILNYLDKILPSSAANILGCKHPLCPHEGAGCLEDILLNGLAKPFLYGWSAQLLMGSVPRILTLKPGALSATLLNSSWVFSRKRASFGLFLAAFTGIYKTMRCGLRQTTNDDSSANALIAALAASPAHYLAPNTSVTLYLVWKCAESFFSIGAKNGMIPCHRLIVPIIYALSCSQLFYASILDPKQIKPSYVKFLDRVTDNKLQQINRNVLEVFGTSATGGYHTFMPDYQLPHTTRRFQESVLAWLL